MPHAWQNVGGVIRETGGGYGSNLLVVAYNTGPIPGVRI